MIPLCPSKEDVDLAFCTYLALLLLEKAKKVDEEMKVMNLIISGPVPLIFVANRQFYYRCEIGISSFKKRTCLFVIRS